MAKRPSPLFLERRSYRQRRLMDAARLLPMLGAVLWAVPLLWPENQGVGVGDVATSTAILYVFGVWLMLVGLAAWIAVRLEDGPDRDDRG